jgi:putative spermidine/putrescine transport system substrate-binding protein
MARRNGKAEPKAPQIVLRREQPKLRILCTEITPYRQLMERARLDLGFELEFEAHDFVTAQRIAATQPDRYDVYDQCFHNLDIVWYWRAIKPIEIDRIELWDEVNDLTKKGAINSVGSIGLGDAPVTRLYVQQDNSLSSAPSTRISMLPTVHNFDSFAVNEAAAGIDVDQDVRSWAELLSPRWKGRISIVDEPAIGFFDIALAARAAGKVTFRDPGNMSVDEVDKLMDFALGLKREGYFVPFWKTTQDATRLMENNDVVISSMWSPSVVALKARHIRIRQAVPIEGYRGWHGGLCIARHLEGHRLDQTYAYLNWFLSGWPGAVAARQGYYISVPERIRDHLEEEEWAYWYEGKPASRPLPDPNGIPAIRPGEVRSGGSYWSRASQIAIWNTTMDEHNYLVRRWGELIGNGLERGANSRKIA